MSITMQRDPTGVFQSRRSVAIVTRPVASRGAFLVRSSRRRRCTAPTCRSRSSWSGATTRSGFSREQRHSQELKEEERRHLQEREEVEKRHRQGEYICIFEPNYRIQGVLRPPERPKVACLPLKKGRSVLPFLQLWMFFAYISV